MGAADIQQWLEEHGGQARDPVTDANGVTTYVSADGNYITVTKDGTVRLRGFSPPSGAAPSSSAAAPAASAAQAPAAPADTTGADGTDATGAAATGPIATYTQDQVNARLAEIGQQIGGQPRYVPQQRTRRVANPAAVISDPRFVPGSPAYIDQPYTVESWYDPRTNTLLYQGQRQSDGTFQTTTDAAPRPPRLTAAQTQALVPSTPRTEGTPIPGQLNPDGSQAYDNTKPIMVHRDANNQQIGQAEPLTAEQRANWERDQNEAAGRGRYTNDELQKRGQAPVTGRQEVQGHAGVFHVVSKDALGNSDDHYEDANGQRVAPPVDLKPTFIADGHGGQIAVITKPDGTFTTQPVPGVSSPQQLTVSGTVYERGPDGVYKPAAGIPDPNAPLPPGAPDLDLSDPQKAYDSFMRLYQWGASQVNRGEKSADWLKNLIAGPHEALSAVLDREKEMTRRAENAQGNQLTQRSQDISFADNRLSNATQGLQTATSAADKINSLAGPGLHAYSSTLLGTLALQGLQNQALGGTNQLPASVIPGPLAQPGAAMPGQGALGQPAGAVPDAAAAQAEADRQRAQAAQGAAVGPVGAGITATNAAAVNPTGANVGAATDATMAGSTAAFGGLGVGSGTSGPVFAPQPPTNIQPQTTPPPFVDQAPPPGSPPFSIPPGSVDRPGPLQLDPMSQPQGMATGVSPTMAMMGSRLGQNAYAYALDALRRHGIGEDSIMAAHQDFLNG